HAYPGDRPDVTQFTTVIDQLRGRYEAITAAAGVPSGGGTDMTVVFDAGQNSEDNFAHLAGTGLRYVGSVPASDCPDLTALPASARAIVDQERFGGLTACDTRRVVYGTQRRGVLTPSPPRHAAAGDPHLPARAAPKPGPRVHRHHLAQGRQETRRPGRHLGPRQDPPAPRQGRSRDHRDYPQALGAAGGYLAAHR